MIKKLSSKKAFTIIEVVLVLGIAGLILLAVFIAVPALQRSKRNQIRKDDMTRIMNAIVSYQGSHSGKVPIYFVANSQDDAGGTAKCADPEKAIDSKSCFRIHPEFITKYIDSDVDTSAEPFQNGGWEYPYTCKVSGGCAKFTDPNGTIYRFKAEGRSFSHGREQLLSFSQEARVIHLAAYAKCSSDGGTKDEEATGVAAATNDANDVALVYRLEGSNAPFCIDNQ